MAESIRRLTVSLGYDIDMTGANTFKSSLGNLSKALDRLSDNYDKSIKKMGSSNKRFVITAGDVVNAIKKVARQGKKVFLAFADIQQARVSLAFKTSQKEADVFIKKIADITKATGGYVSQIDALNAVTFGGNITDDTEFFVRNLDKIIKLSKVANKDFKETSAAIAQFIATGSGLDQLVDLRIISASEKDRIERTKTAGLLTKQGISARAVQAQGFLTAGSPRADTFFKEYQKTGGASIDQMATSAENFNIAIGERLNPAITYAANGIKTYTDRLDKVLKKEGFSKEFFGNVLGDPEDKDARKFFGTSYDFFFKNPPANKQGIRSSAGQSTVTDNSVTNITVNGVGDAESVANKVIAKKAKKIIDNSVMRTPAQSQPEIRQPKTSP